MATISIILGTARKNRASERVYTHLCEVCKNCADTVHAVDVREHITTAVTTPPWGESGANKEPTQWQEIARASDAFIFILPEYNHGYPGEWKLLIDALFDEYNGKAAYLVTISAGDFAGVRVADHVQPVLHELGLTLCNTSLHIGTVKEVFGEGGSITDEATKERVQEFVSILKNKYS